MNWLTFIQKRKRLLVAALMALMVLVTLVGFLVGVPVRTLMASWVGSLVGLPLSRAFAWALARDIAREKKENNGPGLILPPGTWLRNVLHVIYSPKIAERVFDQIIADMQLEWQAAMIHDRKWLANWIQVRGVLTVLLTVLVHAVAALGSIFFKLVK